MQLEGLAAWIRPEMGVFKGHPGRSNPYPELLRCRTVEYYRARRAQGVRLRNIAIEVGGKWQTLSRWTSSDKPARLNRAAGITNSMNPIERVRRVVGNSTNGTGNPRIRRKSTSLSVGLSSKSTSGRSIGVAVADA